MSWRYFPAVIFCTLVSLSPASGGKHAHAEPQRRVSILWDDLARPLSAERFREQTTLGDALKTLKEEYRVRHGKELPIFVDIAPFKLENPDAPDLAEVSVQLLAVPRERTTAQILRALIGQIPTANATLFVKPGVIEITTQHQVAPATLLQQTIDLRFERQPLSLVLEEIYEQTGVYVILDPRVGMRARTPITLRFTNDLKLGSGLMLIAEMANLKLIVDDNALFITTPAAAQSYWQERTRQQMWLFPRGTAEP